MIGRHTCMVYPDPHNPAGVDLACLVDEITLTHGRSDATEAPEASSATIDLDLTDTALPATVDVGGLVVVATEFSGWTSTRFVGRITDVNLGWDDAAADTPNAGIGQLVAVSMMADLGRRVIGDVPFPAELDGARVSRVLELAGVVLDANTSDPGTVTVNPRDVDAADAMSVARATADSAGGLVWETREGKIRYADSEHRRGTDPALTLNACDVLVTPTWTRNLDGLINKVSIGYGIAPENPPEGESSEQPRWMAQNDQSIGRFGIYDYSVATELATLADAQAMASLLTTRGAYPAWVMSALPLDMVALSEALTAAVLDLDMHALLKVTGLPVVAAGGLSTAFLWVEGWTERLAWDEHEITLAVSSYCRTAPPPLWNNVSPEWTWDTVPPAMTWDGAACIGPPVDVGRWDDVAASVRWDTVPPETTWDTYTGSNL